MDYKEPKKKRNNIIIGPTTSFLNLLIELFRIATKVIKTFSNKKNAGGKAIRSQAILLSDEACS